MDAVINRWKNANPVKCQLLGLHAFDGILPIHDMTSIAQRVTEIDQDLVYLKIITVTGLEILIKQVLEYKLQAERFDLTVLRLPHQSPLFWVEALNTIENSFIAKSDDSLENRLHKIISIERQIPKYLNQMDKMLDDELYALEVSRALELLQYIYDFFDNQLLGLASMVDDEELLFAWSDVNIEALRAIKFMIERLENHYLVHAHQQYALGKDNFLEYIRVQEALTLDIDALLQKVEKEIILHQHQLDLSMIDQANHDSDPLNLASSILIQTLGFIQKNDVIEIPSHQCEVIYTPKYARKRGIAALSAPGPFEEEMKNYLWVTPMKNHGYQQLMLHMICIHEIYPGHLVQALYHRKADDRLALLSHSHCFVEGWAHYAEELMISLGYGDENITRTYHHAALLRNLRLKYSILLHSTNISREEAITGFEDIGLLDRDMAEDEVDRISLDPIALAYTLGRYQIKELVEKLGRSSLALKQIHQNILSFGAPPITLLSAFLDTQ
ncbi:MAG: DUF885 family protein [Candidatus Heimdallarchaeota archaeon]|nr:DUF885 family protein [Candidatus Heimdallarchaeota archaeon]